MGYQEQPSPKRLRQNAGSGITARRPRAPSQADGSSPGHSNAAPIHIPAHQLPLPMERLAADALNADDDMGRRLGSGSGSMSQSDAGFSDGGDHGPGARHPSGFAAGQNNFLQQQPAAAQDFTHHQNGRLQPQDPWRDLRGGFEPQASPQHQHQQHQQQFQPMLQMQAAPQPPPQPPAPPPDPQPNKADLVNMRCEIWCEGTWRRACLRQPGEAPRNVSLDAHEQGL